ncbi:MAG: RluA family pseudouridine synthase [Phycisphaera sp.]|nr:RluA family pseudouridine synthase [Phycisphaera sp.]
MPQKSRQLTVTSEQVGRVDRVVQAMTGQTRRQLRGLFDHGCVTVNDQPCGETFARVKEGDRVTVTLDPHRQYHEKTPEWKSSAFRLVHEDEHLLIVDKAPHVLSVPTTEGPSSKPGNKTLLDAVEQYVSRKDKRAHAHVVHRLDRGVSGLLVFAKRADIASTLKDQFAEHKPEREYLAIVMGELKKEHGTFRSHMATAANLDRYSTKTPIEGKAELAITHYLVDRGLKGATLVRVKLETGKRNQIRVHFAEAGHPVLGDPRYGKSLGPHPRWRSRRMALHAARLGFTHPVTGKAVKFEAPLPEPFEKFIAECG